MRAYINSAMHKKEASYVELLLTKAAVVNMYFVEEGPWNVYVRLGYKGELEKAVISLMVRAVITY